MMKFQLYVENRDKEQLRKLGLKPSRMTIGKHPQYDMDRLDMLDDEESNPDDNYNVISTSRQHADPDELGDPGEAAHFAQHVKDRLKVIQPKSQWLLLHRLEIASRKHNDMTMHRSLIEKYMNGEKLDRADWLVAADWMEEHGENGAPMRAYAYKLL